MFKNALEAFMARTRNCWRNMLQQVHDRRQIELWSPIDTAIIDNVTYQSNISCPFKSRQIFADDVRSSLCDAGYDHTRTYVRV